MSLVEPRLMTDEHHPAVFPHQQNVSLILDDGSKVKIPVEGPFYPSIDVGVVHDVIQTLGVIIAFHH
jgi:hypothetical protein